MRVSWLASSMELAEYDDQVLRKQAQMGLSLTSVKILAKPPIARIDRLMTSFGA